MERKGLRHLEEDFGISIAGMSNAEIGIRYMQYVEEILNRPDLVVRLVSTLNKQ